MLGGSTDNQGLSQIARVLFYFVTFYVKCLNFKKIFLSIPSQDNVLKLYSYGKSYTCFLSCRKYNSHYVFLMDPYFIMLLS